MRCANDRSNKPLKVKERDVSRTCVDYLQLRGWHCVRQNAGPYGGKGVADYVALHYRRGESMWIEFKSPADRRGCRCATMRRGRCTSCLQAEFAQMVTGMGGRVMRVKSADEFFDWYERLFGLEGQMRLEMMR